jgi:tetratricopeptide (TPR) repeat protein
LLPRCYLDLADIYKQENALAQQRETLEAALRINPHWDHALMELAENFERRGDYAGELRMLQAAATASPASARMQAYLADALWKHERADEALRAIRRALQLAPAYDWAWGRLRAWCEHLNQPALLLQTARSVAEEKPGQAASWYYLAQAEEGLDEVLAALDRAIACNPNYLVAYEEKIETLARHHCYSDASQVIDDYDRGDGVPVELRRYIPWLDYRRGESERAIHTLKALLEEEPGYYNGWSMLASWCEESERAGDFLLACRRMVKLQPDNSAAWVQLSDALLLNTQRDEAKQALQQALVHAPRHDYAGLSLFDLQLEDDELDAAAETLAHQQTHLPPESQGYLTTRALQLACRRGEQQQALACFHQLSRDPRENRWYFDTAIDAFREAGWQDLLEVTFDELVQDLTGINPACATVWAERQHQGKSAEWHLSNHSIERLLQMGVAGHRVVDDYLGYLHDLGSVVRLGRLIKHHSHELRQDPQTLASVGYIFAAQQRYKENVAWMHGWREMRELPTWALNNFAISLRELGMWDQQYEVLQRMRPIARDELADAVRLWLGLESALRGNIDTAKELYALIDDTERLSSDNFFAYQLLQAVLAFERSSQHPLEQRLQQVIATLRHGHHDYHGLIHNIMLWRLQHRVLWQLAQRMAPLPGTLYYWWRMMHWSKFLL